MGFRTLFRHLAFMFMVITAGLLGIVFLKDDTTHKLTIVCISSALMSSLLAAASLFLSKFWKSDQK